MKKSKTIQSMSEYFGVDLEVLSEANFFHSDPGVYSDKSSKILGLNLSGLNIDDDKFTSFVTKFYKDIEDLRFLDLSQNKLTNPIAINLLRNIYKLDLAVNFISNLEFLDNLPDLETLNLRCNQITDVPDFIFEKNFEVKIYDDWTGGLVLEGNPIEGTSLDNLKVKIEEQRLAKYEKIMEDGVYSRNECRIQLIGSGGAGKTTLSKALADLEFLPNEPATKGMKIWEAAIDDIRLKLWDFGGQEAMYSVHRLFIADGDLFIIVLDSRHNEQADGWIDFILSISPTARLFIVLNKIDENASYDLNRNSLFQKYSDNLLGIFRLSATRKNEDKFEKFASDLKSHLIGYAQSELPEKFRAFFREFEDSKEPFLRLVQYQEIAAAGGLDENASNLALEQLKKLGVVVSAELPSFGKVLIRSRWLAKNMYPLLEPDLRLLESVTNGIVGIEDLKKIWLSQRSSIDIEDSAPNEDESFELILEVMEANDLSQRLVSDDIFVPNFLDANEPAMDAFLDQGRPRINIIFRCSFLPKLLFQKLQVELERGYKVLSRWRSGLVVESLGEDFDDDYRCILTGDFHENQIEIISMGADRSPGMRDMYKIVKRNLQSVAHLDFLELLRHSEGRSTRADTQEYFELSFEDILYCRKSGVDRYLCGKYKRDFSIAEILSEIPKEMVYDTNEYKEQQQISLILGELNSLRSEINSLKSEDIATFSEAKDLLDDVDQIDPNTDPETAKTKIRKLVKNTDTVVKKVDGYSKSGEAIAMRLSRIGDLITSLI